MQDHPVRDIAERVERLAHLFRARSQLGALNPAQWAALRYLARANRFSRHPSAVARYLGATKGTVSQTLISLERKGLIARQRSAPDRRLVALALTAEGEAYQRRDPLQDIEAASALLGDNAAILAHLLDQLLRAMDDIVDTAPFGGCANCQHAENRRCRHFASPIDAAMTEQLCVAFDPLPMPEGAR